MMGKTFELTCSQYANYYATIPHKGCGRPKTGNTSGIRAMVREGRDMPGVKDHRMIGKTYLLRVSEKVYNDTLKIISEKSKN